MAELIFRTGERILLKTEAEDGENLLLLMRKNDISVDAPCNGNGLCGKCRVRILNGTVQAGKNRHISDEEYENGWRLACEAAVSGDAEIEVPEKASAFRTGIRTADLNDPKTASLFEGVVNTLKEEQYLEKRPVRCETVHLDAPSLDDTMPDNERLMWKLEELTGKKVSILLPALLKLAGILRENDFSVRVILQETEELVKVLDAVSPEEPFTACGAAIDIGTTTVSGALLDLETGKLLARASMGNGQIIYGADVINRIIESVKDGGALKLKRAIVQETLVPLLSALSEQSGIPLSQIYRVAIAGNTTMEHLLLGVYSDPVRMEPYIPSFFSTENFRAGDIIPGLSSAAELFLAPNVGSYVGGDITAGIFASGMWKTPENTLFIDLGTNGELVVGNEEYMMTCACSAGPAFEGGDISCGMRATDGAIQAVSIDKESMEPVYDIIGNGKIRGLCGSGLIDMIAELFRTGTIGPNGKFIREGRRIRHDEHGTGAYIVAFPEETEEETELSINEVDIDNFIRAKGAIFSAILLILSQLGMEVGDIEHIQIAGGIGSGINFRNAIRIGMFPDVPMERFSYIGNSSLFGAAAAVLSEDAEEKIRELAKNMMYVELSAEPGYIDEFVAACFLPHTNSSLFPNQED